LTATGGCLAALRLPFAGLAIFLPLIAVFA
jgi:hypothetical protein